MRTDEHSHETPAALQVLSIAIGKLTPSPTNPRKHFDQAKLDELAESMKVRGILQPILVRPRGNGKADAYEIVAGERRYRAAKIAELPAMPAVIRDLDDVEVLECQTIENLQRDDLHPLEEAAGYQALIARAKYDVAKIAAKVGRSVKYVYDRVKLLDLTDGAQKLFLEGRMTAGHAILLARLEPKDQARALSIGDEVYHRPALFTDERGLFDGASDEEYDAQEKAMKRDPYAFVKPVSVREFARWIDHEVRATPERVIPTLFPETAAFLDAAQEAGEKVVPIMNLTQTPVAARDAGWIFTENAWKRADGAKGSKRCDFGEPGMVVIGPGRYDAFTICRKKERCKVHWASEIKAREQRQKAAAAAQASGKDPRKAERDKYAEQERKRREENERQEAERKRWLMAWPAVMQALAAAVKKAPTKATGLLARLIIEGLDSYEARSKDVEQLVPRGRTAEDLVRHAAMIVIASQGGKGWRAEEELVPMARAFNVDARKIRDQAAPVQTSGKPGKPVRGTCRKCGCQENTPCASGCGWADKTETRCTACFPPTLKSRAKKGGRS